MKPLPAASFPSFRRIRPALVAAIVALGGFFAGMLLDIVHVSMFRTTSPAAAHRTEGKAGDSSLRQRPMDENLERRTRALSGFLAISPQQETAAQRRQRRVALLALRREDFPLAATAAARQAVDAPSLLEPLFEQWGRVAPVEAAAFLQEQAPTLGKTRPRCTQALARVWAAQQPEAAQAFAAGLTAPPDRAAAIAGVMEGMATTDPQAALRWRASFPPMIPTPREAGFLSRWGQVDPAAAILDSWARMSGDPERGIHSFILTSWTERDPEAALAWLRRQSDEKAVTAMQSAWQTWWKNEPATALEAARQTGDARLWRSAVEHVAGTYASLDPDVFERFVTTLSEEDRALAWKHVSLFSLPHDPLRAAIWRLRSQGQPVDLPALPKGDGKNPPTPDAILAFADQHLRDDEDNYAKLLETVAKSTFQQDPLGTLERVRSRPEFPGYTLWMLLIEYADFDLPAALAWTDRYLLSQPTNERYYAPTFLQHLSTINPAAAATYFTAHADNYFYSGMAGRLASAWAASDPLRARRWADSLPPVGQDDAYGEFGAMQFFEEESAVDPWFEGLEAGPKRDAALAGLAWTLAFSDPAAAAHRASQIGDRKRRLLALEEIMTAWEKVDPAAAAAWQKQQAR